MRRRSSSSSSISSPLAAGALLLLLLACCGLLHGAAAARLLPAAAVVVPPLEDGPVKVVAADGLALGNGADEQSVSELMGAEAAAEEVAEAACDDECMQRRLLRDAHLDYIYTQHKGKP